MANKTDIVGLGELLIDFTEAGISKSGMRLFEQNPGGAPANLLTVARHMGYKTAFIGKVGQDMHGTFLKETLQKEGICTDYIIEDPDSFTTLAFVQINNGERQFSFARKPGADTRLNVNDLDRHLLETCRIFHFGSLSLTDEPVRHATIEAVNIAKTAGALISYDPNYRETLWTNEAAAIETMKSVIKFADFMKVSDEESLLITGEPDYESAARKLLNMGPKLVAVTLGSDGVLLATKKNIEKIQAYKTEVVDTTGAGDSFWGGFLSRYLSYGRTLDKIEWSELKECACYGNATACLCVQKRGGIPAIPEKNEVESLIRKYTYI